MAILGSKQRRQPRHIFLYLALFHHALFSENHLPFSTSCSISRPSGKAALIRTRRSRERGSGEWGNRHRKADSFAARRGRHTLHQGASAVPPASAARWPAWPSAWELSGLLFVTECCSKLLSSPFEKMCEFTIEEAGKMCYAHSPTSEGSETSMKRQHTGHTDAVAYLKKIKAIWRRRHGNPVPFSHFTVYSDALSAYIPKKYMQITWIAACFSAHNML